MSTFRVLPQECRKHARFVSILCSSVCCVVVKIRMKERYEKYGLLNNYFGIIFMHGRKSFKYRGGLILRIVNLGICVILMFQRNCVCVHKYWRSESCMQVSFSPQLAWGYLGIIRIKSDFQNFRARCGWSKV